MIEFIPSGAPLTPDHGHNPRREAAVTCAAMIALLLIACLLPESETFEPAGLASAQCAAVCLRNFGSAGVRPPFSAYRGLSCDRSPCRECLLACQGRAGGPQACKSLCSRWNPHQSSLWRVCAASCRRFYAAFDRLLEDHGPAPAAYFRFSHPKIACVQAEQNEGLMSVTLTWGLRASKDQTPLARLPVTFLIEVRSGRTPGSLKVSPLTFQGMAVIEGLNKKDNYTFRVRAVDFQGRFVDSALENLSGRNFRHLELTHLKAKLSVVDRKLFGEVSWHASLPVCLYQVALIRMTKLEHDSSRQTVRKFTFNGTLPAHVVRFDLAFGQKYLAKILPFWPSDEGGLAPHFFIFSTPPCATLLTVPECLNLKQTYPQTTTTPDPLLAKLFKPKDRSPRLLPPPNRPQQAKSSLASAPRLQRQSQRSTGPSTVLLAALMPLTGVTGFLLLCGLFRLAQHHFSFREAFLKNHSALASEAEGEGPADPYEVPFSSLELLDEVGRGEFGIVHRGQWFLPRVESAITVAVKLLQPERSGTEEVRAFREEINLMKAIGQHPNVLSLLGCCTRPETPLCLITDFCPIGNLRDYLLDLRGAKQEPELRLLLQFGHDVASGMGHLAARRFVHRDLACRNILLDRGLVAKVADFGLSRDIYRDSLYSWDQERRLPFRWMAPEALVRRVFTSASDVWSFGIVMWEITSLGAVPFALLSGPELADALQTGERLPKPKMTPSRLYELMEGCWTLEPEMRPSFGSLKQQLEAMIARVQEATPPGTPCRSQAFAESFEINSFGYLDI